MQEIKEDLKEIKAELKSISDTLLRNTVSLEIHEKRTSLAEKRIEHLEGQFKWAVGLVASSAVALISKLLSH